MSFQSVQKIDHLKKKYSSLASEAKNNGNMVEYELYSQFLEHCNRVGNQNSGQQSNYAGQQRYHKNSNNGQDDRRYNNQNRKKSDHISVDFAESVNNSVDQSNITDQECINSNNHSVAHDVAGNSDENHSNNRYVSNNRRHFVRNTRNVAPESNN